MVPHHSGLQSANLKGSGGSSVIGVNSCPHALGFAAPVRALLMVSLAAKMDSCPLSAISLWNASSFGLSVS